jgi:hypothetical protein
MKMMVLAVSAVVLLPAISTSAQTGRELNSLVARADRARGPAPADCEQGLSAEPALRVDVNEIPMPEVELAEAPAPPSGALGAALQETQVALTRNDRPAFDAALARAKSLLATYPTGAERRTAEDIVRLHEAAGRLWNAQYESPFFGEDDPVYATVRAWPGYGEAVRRSVLTDRTGRRFYPAAESRDFATRLAGERLQRLGIHPVTTRIAREESPVMRAPRETASRSTPSPTPRKLTPRRSTATASTPRRATTHTASAPPPPHSSTPHSSTPAPRPAPATTQPRKTAVASTAPSPPNPSAPPTTTAVPAPAPAAVTENAPLTPSSPAAGEIATTAPLGSGGPSPADDPATGTAFDTAPATTSADATTADATTASDTAATSATSTADTAVSTDALPGAEPPGAGRSVILPAILILVGLGVLIVLFRASK